MRFSLSSWLFRKQVHATVRLSGRHVAEHRVVNPYHAVSVAPGSDCCAVARDLLGRRFLSKEAPSLPLSGCTAERCTCRYQHHADRRSGGDRRIRDAWNVGVVSGGRERRVSRGRRVTDV